MNQNSNDQAFQVEIVQTSVKTFFARLFYSKTGEPFDLTNVSEIVASFPGADGTPIQKTYNGSGGVTIVGAPGAGKIQIALTSGDTASMQPNPQIGQPLQLDVTIGSATAQQNTLSFGSPPVALTTYTVSIDDVDVSYVAQSSDTAQTVFASLMNQLEAVDELNCSFVVSGSGNDATLIITSLTAGEGFDCVVSAGITNTDTTPNAGMRTVFILPQALLIFPQAYGNL